jgi:hypothetical protein
MVHRFFILSALLFSNSAFTQITNLSVQSRIGYDCTQESNDTAAPLRGGCLYNQTLDYRRNKRAFKTNRLCDLHLFRPYKGGFLPNSIRDSVHDKHLFLRRRLSTRDLEALLLPILQLKRDSVLVFDAADFSGNARLIAVCEDSAAVVMETLNRNFRVLGISTTVRNLIVSFDRNGVHYTLFRDYSNQFWRLQYTSGTREMKYRFVHTQLDAFFTRRLPQTFDGRFLTDNHLLEEELKDWLQPEE